MASTLMSFKDAILGFLRRLRLRLHSVTLVLFPRTPKHGNFYDTASQIEGQKFSDQEVPHNDETTPLLKPSIMAHTIMSDTSSKTNSDVTLTPTDESCDNSFREEDSDQDFKAGQFFPVNIGDVYDGKYEVIGKLGFGTTATVWLARSVLDNTYAALKIHTESHSTREAEFLAYQTVAMVNPSHNCFGFVVTAREMFKLERLNDKGQLIHHNCLVLEPMWDSLLGLLQRSPSGCLSTDLLKLCLGQLLMGLHYLHTECQMVHTDISAQNIMIEFQPGDDSSFEDFAQAELEMPSRRKLVDNIPVYQSRQLSRPRRIGNIVLSDLGSVVSGKNKQTHDAQPNIYRSPEVMLKTEWSYPIDIWNVGCLIWDLYLGGSLFDGYDEHHDKYTTRAHLAELVSLLGPPPADLLAKGTCSTEFFTEDGQWVQEDEIPIPDLTWENATVDVDEEELEGFLNFVKAMLQWRPEDRKTAAELLEDPWLCSV